MGSFKIFYRASTGTILRRSVCAAWSSRLRASSALARMKISPLVSKCVFSLTLSLFLTRGIAFADLRFSSLRSPSHATTSLTLPSSLFFQLELALRWRIAEVQRLRAQCGAVTLDDAREYFGHAKQRHTELKLRRQRLAAPHLRPARSRRRSESNLSSSLRGNSPRSRSRASSVFDNARSRSSSVLEESARALERAAAAALDSKASSSVGTAASASAAASSTVVSSQGRGDLTSRVPARGGVGAAAAAGGGDATDAAASSKSKSDDAVNGVVGVAKCSEGDGVKAEAVGCGSVEATVLHALQLSAGQLAQIKQGVLARLHARLSEAGAALEWSDTPRSESRIRAGAPVPSTTMLAVGGTTFSTVRIASLPLRELERSRGDFCATFAASTAAAAAAAASAAVLSSVAQRKKKASAASGAAAEEDDPFAASAAAASGRKISLPITIGTPSHTRALAVAVRSAHSFISLTFPPPRHISSVYCSQSCGAVDLC